MLITIDLPSGSVVNSMSTVLLQNPRGIKLLVSR